jgi:uracil-DNA glycosylase family 4
MAAMSWDSLNRKIVRCDRCPRLREYCAAVAKEKRAAFRDWDYWGKPVPNFGDPLGRLLIVGLAPAAHGANRTGRMFTGDRSGDFLYAALHETGFATQPTAVRIGDGLELIDAAITAPAHCAPPANKPTTQELANCFGFLRETVEAMPNLRAVLALGGIGFDACLKLYASMGWAIPPPRPVFGHGKIYELGGGSPLLVACYHPSQQNTFTGRLTPGMMEEVLRRTREAIGARPHNR